MQDLIQRIARQQKDMGYKQLIDESMYNRIDYARDITLALIKETTEFLDEIPWKPWKSPEEQELNIPGFKRNL